MASEKVILPHFHKNSSFELKSECVIYDIRGDSALIEEMCEAQLSKGPWGVTLDHGLVCSDTWWSALETGQVKLETFSGKIKSVPAGILGDTLEVHIEGANGTQRWLAWRGFEPVLNGKNVCISYVQMQPKTQTSFRPDFFIRVLLQVELIS